MRSNEARDAAIVAAHEQGDTYTALGRLYGISRGRVGQIVYAARRAERLQAERLASHRRALIRTAVEAITGQRRWDDDWRDADLCDWLRLLPGDPDHRPPQPPPITEAEEIRLLKERADELERISQEKHARLMAEFARRRRERTLA